MKVIADWLDLKVRQYEDGSFEAYEALDNSCKEGDWDSVRRFIENLLYEIEAEIERRK